MSVDVNINFGLDNKVHVVIHDGPAHSGEKHLALNLTTKAFSNFVEVLVKAQGVLIERIEERATRNNPYRKGE